MKKLFLFAILLIAAFALYWFKFRTTEPTTPEQPKQAAITVKKHSEAFNKSVDSVINTYLAIKDALVNEDSVKAKADGISFVELLNHFPVEELKKDTASIFETAKGNLQDMIGNAESLTKQTTILEMRRDLYGLTEVMYPSFFKAINYEGQKLYYTNCPMAFDNQGANWISNSAQIVNPYMGKVHPKYKSSMLSCGEVKDSIEAK